MANIISSIAKMTDTEINSDQPLSQSLFLKIGANLNGLIDRGARKAEFTASGSWICPADVTQVTLYGAGGGGGGATGGFTPDGNSGTVAGAGGAGALPILTPFKVTPGTTYAVTIGAGGAGGVAMATGDFGPVERPGSSGSATTFGTLVTFYGASGGFINAQSGSNGGWSPALQATSGGIANGNGQASPTAPGGLAGYRDGNTGRGGGGGGAGIGAGGNGGAGSRNANAGAGLPGGLSAGGGAGGGVYGGGNFLNGGNGGPGYLLITY